MRTKLQENQGITAGMVMTVVLTAALTGHQAEDRAATFLTTLGSCAIGVGVTWLIVRRLNRVQDEVGLPIPEDEAGLPTALVLQP